MDVSQYLEIFIDESNEHLQSLSDQLLILEKEPENSDTINEIFRAAHSLKGMAGTMGYKRMQNLTHDMENVFSEVRNGNIKVTSDMCDVLFKCLDALESYVSNIQNTQDEGTDDNEPIIKALNSFIGGNEVEEKKEASASQPAEEVAQGTTSELVFADFEMNAVNEALKKGLGVYEIVVTVDENCILKAARAFLVFKNLEGHCDVIKSEPSTQDIEDEKFEKDFTIVVVSHESLDEVISIIKSVSEIKTAEGKAITVPFQEVNDAPAEEEKKEEVKKQPAVTEPAKKEEAKKTAAASPAKKAATANNKAVSHTVRVDIDKLDVLMNLVSELIIAKNGLVSASISSDEAATTNNQKFTEQIEYLERVTTNLHESVMKVRMMPIEGVISKFPRMIRDLNKKLNKKMELYITGEETELDRTVLDEIGDPIMHLLRNSADHGLESAEVRAERGKPEVGSIYLNAFQEGNNVVIEVSDDGNGIDIERVKAKAVEKGKSAFAGCEITGKKLGVIGLGAIGGMVANTMRHLGMNVIGHDPYLSVDAAWNISRDVEKAASYDDIYKVADYITLHVPSTPDTKGMINAETIAKMKDGVRIVNLARGDLVNMADMKAALESGKVAAYVTDFPTEESVGVPGVITIPHLGASTAEAEENCAVMAAKELTEFLENGNIKNSVNFPNASMPHIGDARICIMHTNTPNMLASISAVVASENLNIENLLNRSKGEYAYTMIELNGNIPASVEAELNKVPGVIRVNLYTK